MSEVFETERLLIRSWRHEDAARILDTYSREDVIRFLGSTPTPLISLDEAHARVDHWNARSPDDPTYGIWAAEVQATGVVAGTVLLAPIPDAVDGAVEVGWHLHPDSWGFGYATEAARGAIDRGHASGLAEIVAVVVPANEPSLAVCRRIGMTHLGIVDRYYGKDLELFVSRRLVSTG